MAWTLQSDRPIYAQLVERLKTEIVSGVYPPGRRLPSVRELAATASVNPNTMQKAFAELERTGLIITMRTSGRVVTEDTAMINETRREPHSAVSRPDEQSRLRQSGNHSDALGAQRRGHP